MRTVRVGFVGLGIHTRKGTVSRWCDIEGTEIVALCDLSEERIEAMQTVLRQHGRQPATPYTDYRPMCERDDIDLVYISTDWLSHAQIALHAMRNGKHAAIEVPAATTIDECWQLVETSRKTGMHCMMLENCVYDRFELACLQMARRGTFGEIVHVEGAYLHYGDKQHWNDYWNNWRLDYNRRTRGDVYPTHGLGPACQLLDIHRSDHLDYLVSIDTAALSGPNMMDVPCPDFKNGDVTTTLIRTRRGRTILLQHDVMTPRPYDRRYQIVGTEGFAQKYPIEQICLGSDEPLSKEETEKLVSANMPDFIEDIRPQLDRLEGRNKMSFVMDYRLAYCLQRGLPLDMDVVDLAEWCCVSELSRLSIERGSQPVKFPDFIGSKPTLPKTPILPTPIKLDKNNEKRI